ncbi:MAG: sterol desaturase family protein, partial [Pseudomonadota bacterium]
MEGLGETLLAFKGVAVGAWLVLLFTAERLKPAVPFPHAPAKNWIRPARNLSFLVISTVVSLAIVVPVSRWAAELELGLRPGWASGAPGLAFDLLLLDFLIYWWHRANHQLPFLWRFHEVHHLDRFLDTTSALRFHFGEVILSALARAGVIALFAMPLPSILVFEALV